MRGRPSAFGWGALFLLAAPLAHAQGPTNIPREDPLPAAAPAVTPPPPPVVPVQVAPVPPSDCVADRFLVLQERGFSPALASELRTDFATELAHRGLSLCEADALGGREPAAVVDVQANDSVVIISLDDRVTHKRVARDLSLHGIPANGRALAVAIAIDELLRASWAELTLRRPGELEPEETDEEDDVEDTRTVNARRPRRHVTRYQLGADLSYLHTSRNFDAFALSARVTAKPWGWGWFVAELGGLSSVPVSSPNGDVLAVGGRTALTAGACSLPRGRVSGCAGARLELDLLSLRGIRPEQARARNELAGVVHASLIGALTVLLHERTYMFGEASLGAMLQGTEATDGTNTLLGVTGMLFTLHVGLGYEL